MKLQVLQENLSKAVNITSRFTSSKAQLPVLSNILLSSRNNKLYLSATNLENSISMSIGAKIDTDGEITVPAKVVNDIVASLNPGALDISVDKDVLKISSEGFKTTISGMNSSDFPSVPRKIGKDYVEFVSKDFVSSLNEVLFSVSVDETRPILTGVLMLFLDKKTTLVSTDGFRLSRSEFKTEFSKISEKVVIPRGILNEIIKTGLNNDSILYSYKKGDNQVVFKLGNMILSSRVFEGDFPDYEKIIPQTSKLSVGLDKNELSQAVKLSSVFSRDSANVVKMNILDSKVELTSESQYSGSQTSLLNAKVEGMENISKDGFLIAFNYRFIEEFINVVQGEDIKISFNEINSPGVFKDSNNEDYLHLIMPVKLQT